MTIVTWDASKKHSTIILTNGNLSFEKGSSIFTVVLANLGKTSGKWYWEYTIDSGETFMLGVGTENIPLISNTQSNYINSNHTRAWMQSANGSNKIGGFFEPYGTRIKEKDTVGVAIDIDTGAIEFFLNGLSQGIAYSDLNILGKIYPIGSIVQGNVTPLKKSTVNFGATKFKYPIPKGYYSYDGSQYGSGYKTLILSENNAYSYDKNSGVWVNNGVFPTNKQDKEQFFNDFGMEDIFEVDWNQLKEVLPNGKGKIIVMESD